MALSRHIPAGGKLCLSNAVNTCWIFRFQSSVCSSVWAGASECFLSSNTNPLSRRLCHIRRTGNYTSFSFFLGGCDSNFWVITWHFSAHLWNFFLSPSAMWPSQMVSGLTLQQGGFNWVNLWIIICYFSTVFHRNGHLCRSKQVGGLNHNLTFSICQHFCVVVS